MLNLSAQAKALVNGQPADPLLLAYAVHPEPGKPDHFASFDLQGQPEDNRFEYWADYLVNPVGGGVTAADRRTLANVYALVDALQQSNQAEAALKVTRDDLALYPADSTMYALQAKIYAVLGHRLHQHRAQAESYALLGQTPAAVLQMELAQKAGDGNFYEQSQVDARLRELKKRQIEEDKLRKKEGNP